MKKALVLFFAIFSSVGIAFASDATIHIAKIMTYADGSGLITVKQISDVAGDPLTESTLLYFPDATGSLSGGFVGTSEGIKKLFAAALLAYQNQSEVRLGYRTDNNRYTITYLTVR